MVIHAEHPRKRHALEHAVRITDLVVYAVVFLGGLYPLVTPQHLTTDNLLDYQQFIGVWASLLLAGGLVGFIGRLSRYWLVETPATVAAAFGIVIYLVILSQYLYTVGAVLVFMLAIIAMAFLVRRWLELQILATEPGSTWRQRIQDVLSRRTTNVVPRRHD